MQTSLIIILLAVIVPALVLYIDSLNLFYYKKVELELGDLFITYWYKWSVFADPDDTNYTYRKVKIHDRKYDKKVEHILHPSTAKNNFLYFYWDKNYEISPMLYMNVLVLRDAVVSMGIDPVTLEYLDINYIFKRREETEYIGKIEEGEYIPSSGTFQTVESSELNY